MTHPDDERLAALAGGEPDAAADAALRVHVDGCARCRALVGDLAALRAALADLPDVAPPRPLRLLPPVPEAAPARQPWYRRLIAPVYAMGGVMVLVGAVGLASGGLAGAGAAIEPVSMGGPETGGQGAAASPQARSLFDALFGGGAVEGGERAVSEDTNGDGAPEPAASGPSLVPTAASPSPAPPTTDDASGKGTGSGGGGWPVWPTLPLALLGVGLAFVASGLAIRYVLMPRAG